MELRIITTGFQSDLVEEYPFPTMAIRIRGVGYVKRDVDINYLYFKHSNSSKHDMCITAKNDSSPNWVEVTELKDLNSVSFLNIFYEEKNVKLTKTYLWDSNIVEAQLINEKGEIVEIL